MIQIDFTKEPYFTNHSECIRLLKESEAREKELLEVLECACELLQDKYYEKEWVLVEGIREVLNKHRERVKFGIL